MYKQFLTRYLILLIILTLILAGAWMKNNRPAVPTDAILAKAEVSHEQ